MNFLFDFDGTICDSYKVGIKIANELLIKNGLEPLSPSEEFDLKKVIKTHKIPPSKIPSLVRFGQKELSNHIPKLKVFPGIPQVLRKLKEKHFLAIVTTNSKKNVEVFLKKNKLEKLFIEVNTDFSLFGKDAKIKNIIKKYKLKKEETCYIGDETRDIEAGKKSRVKAVAVTWGYETERLLSKSKPDFIINDPEGLFKI